MRRGISCLCAAVEKVMSMNCETGRASMHFVASRRSGSGEVSGFIRPVAVKSKFR